MGCEGTFQHGDETEMTNHIFFSLQLSHLSGEVITSGAVAKRLVSEQNSRAQRCALLDGQTCPKNNFLAECTSVSYFLCYTAISFFE